MFEELLLRFVATLLACIVTFTIPLIIITNCYRKKVERLEKRVEYLEKSHIEDFTRIEELSDDVNLVKESFNLILEAAASCDDCDEEPEDNIHLIDSEEYLFGTYTKAQLYYNKKDDKLWCSGKDTGFDPCYILHPSKIVGDGLNFFGFRSGSDRIVYVRNHTLKIDFMIRLDEPILSYGDYIQLDDKLEPLKEEEPVKENECRIKSVNGHYEVYVNGKFHCSADTISEAAQELESALAEERDSE